nr:Chain B, Charged multivesicular body protein 4c peptide [synthetic construct]
EDDDIKQLAAWAT